MFTHGTVALCHQERGGGGGSKMAFENVELDPCLPNGVKLISAPRMPVEKLSVDMSTTSLSNVDVL